MQDSERFSANTVTSHYETAKLPFEPYINFLTIFFNPFYESDLHRLQWQLENLEQIF